MKLTIAVFAALVAFSAAHVYLKEEFGDDYESRWIVSDWKKSDGQAGSWAHTAGDWYGDAKADMGLQTADDARFYAISTKHETFSNKGKTLVVQYSVKHGQKIDCGGGYLKLFPSTVNQEKLHGGENEDVYNIMFGPDICGMTKKTHAIFNHNGDNKLVTKEIKCESDELSHVYTLQVNPDNTYSVSIDLEEVQSGSMYDDWEFLAAKEIKDPSVSKPTDWVDAKKIDDPEDVKPAGHDDIPAQVADPEAEKPDDWDDEDDGEWEAPMIDNPDFKGEWKAKKIENPDYKGEWEHPMVANPDFVDDKEVYDYPDFGVVAIEVWQVKAGTIFDNLMITDDPAEAKAFAEATWGKTKDGEKAMFDKVAAEKAAVEEEERKASDAASGDDEDEDDDEEDEEDEVEMKDEM